MTVQGLSSLQRKLRALPLRVKALIREAMGKGADEIVAMAKSLVAVDDGTLRDSIGWTWGKAPRGSLTIGSIKETGGDLTITIYAGDDEAFYARWIEFGTAPHSTSKGGGTKAGQALLSSGGGTSHPGSSARPFFYVSYRALRKRTRGRITRAINKAAKDVAAGG